MKAQLVKHSTGYILFDEKGSPIGATPNVLSNGTFSKLSLKNCQAIERGYDLDELVENEENKHYALGLKHGFQKALDLNNTKLYTLEDMMNCWNKALTFQDHKETLGEYIQSLQQTEWNVDIEMESNLRIGEVVDGSYPKDFPTQKPKYGSAPLARR